MKRHGIRLIAWLLCLVTVCSLISCKKEETLEEHQVALSWHMGKITSEADAEHPEQLVDGLEGFSYSDIIHLEREGTQVSFTDFNVGEAYFDNTAADHTVFVISHWIKTENGEFVLESIGDNYHGRGGRAAEITKYDAEKNPTYTYISSFPNEYIRLCYSSGQTKKNTKKMTFPKVYVEYVRKLGTLKASAEGETYKRLLVRRFLATAKDEQWYEELEGIRLYAMGDSYFGGSKNGKEYVWPNLLAQKYNMKFLNYGIGGSTISNHSDPNKRSNPMVTRIGGMDITMPDIILFEGGRNDFGKGVPLGQDTDQGEETFCGAVNNCLKQLKERYPDALIIGVTVWADDEERHGQAQMQFGEAMLRLCAANGVPCFDAMNTATTKVDMDSGSFRARYCQDQNDVSHLNTEGMILVEPAFERFIAQVYREYLAQKQ